jgi:hypothetical protein
MKKIDAALRVRIRFCTFQCVEGTVANINALVMVVVAYNILQLVCVGIVEEDATEIIG